MYDVVLLVEREMTELDAQQVTSLHEGIDDQVAYHVLMPVEEAAARVHTSMSSLLGPEHTAAPPPLTAEDVDLLERDVVRSAQEGVDACVALLGRTGARADGQVTARDPIDALAMLVAESDAAEAIIVTAPHAVQDFFHVDWTSRARRRLGVPTLHLLEHETFDEQSSGAGEGNTLI
ncbi:MAG: hypothetical protein H0V23_05250 [Nocardioidaceae bacterium]|nr:hypothetical protein [Nocardioidaceae bacterium]